jgi:L-alanine-DL-glutamate epimerase-like enolase superfamily enzyme
MGSGDAMLGFAGHEGLFVGQDPFTIERHVHLLDNLQFSYGRMWPPEVALWDLMGKISGQPLWKLLGGRSNRVRLYASMGQRRPTPERAAAAQSLQQQGFAALKLRFYADTVAENLAVARAVRAAIGPR